ncbi:hypothetical protein B0T16DRAFT_389649 [Cercophora newfieldiana]|uniref:Uncharacterized protein n=1 Tax=Cercophora newfieldiana TaxID=92897 RepID=A0AA39YBL8_9PEZI|nr:hypothetical protein B0T16DRAFT_389649 [Cercophora newfieldiana]
MEDFEADLEEGLKAMARDKLEPEISKLCQQLSNSIETHLSEFSTKVNKMGELIEGKFGKDFRDEMIQDLEILPRSIERLIARTAKKSEHPNHQSFQGHYSTSSDAPCDEGDDGSWDGASSDDSMQLDDLSGALSREEAGNLVASENAHNDSIQARQPPLNWNEVAGKDWIVRRKGKYYVLRCDLMEPKNTCRHFRSNPLGKWKIVNHHINEWLAPDLPNPCHDNRKITGEMYNDSEMIYILGYEVIMPNPPGTAQGDADNADLVRENNRSLKELADDAVELIPNKQKGSSFASRLASGEIKGFTRAHFMKRPPRASLDKILKSHWWRKIDGRLQQESLTIQDGQCVSRKERLWESANKLPVTARPQALVDPI